MATTGRWRDAFAKLTLLEQHKALRHAYEAIARFCEKMIEASKRASNDSVLVTADPATAFVKEYEVYVRKARRYQMRQDGIQEWKLLRRHCFGGVASDF